MPRKRIVGGGMTHCNVTVDDIKPPTRKELEEKARQNLVFVAKKVTLMATTMNKMNSLVTMRRGIEPSLVRHHVRLHAIGEQIYNARNMQELSQALEQLDFA